MKVDLYCHEQLSHPIKINAQMESARLPIRNARNKYFMPTWDEFVRMCGPLQRLPRDLPKSERKPRKIKVITLYDSQEKSKAIPEVKSEVKEEEPHIDTVAELLAELNRFAQNMQISRA